MRLSEDLITKFQVTYFEKFTEHISLETAEAELLDLAELVRITHSKTIKDIDGQENETETVYTSSN
jgi:hypothetical protein